MFFRKYVLVLDSLPDKKAKQEAQGKSLEICIDQLQRNVINDENFDKFTSVKNRYELRTLTAPIKTRTFGRVLDRWQRLKL